MAQNHQQGKLDFFEYGSLKTAVTHEVTLENVSEKFRVDVLLGENYEHKLKKSLESGYPIRVRMWGFHMPINQLIGWYIEVDGKTTRWVMLRPGRP